MNSADLARVKITQRLAEMGKTRNWLSEKSGVNGSSLKTFMDGGGATLKTLDAIAEALGVRPGDLVTDSELPATAPEPKPTPTAAALIKALAEQEKELESLRQNPSAGATISSEEWDLVQQYRQATELRQVLVGLVLAAKSELELASKFEAYVRELETAAGVHQHTDAQSQTSTEKRPTSKRR